MRQLLVGWNLIFFGFLLAYASHELGVAYGFWRNRRNPNGVLVFGFGELAGHFFSSALFLLVFAIGLSATECPSSLRLRWWILGALIVRALGTWPLVLRYSLLPRWKREEE